MKLHRQLLSALLLTAPLALSAESIDAQQAAALAAQQLESTTEALTLVYTATDPVSGEPTYYAFNREGGGFALVAADDRVEHVVLAYNYYGAYNHDDLSGDLRSWMDGYSAAVSKTRQQPADAPRRAPRKATTTEGVPDFVKPLIGDQQYAYTPGYEGYMPWNQYKPFNDYCPEDNGQRCAVGCVAMSMAQVMSKHRWPDHGEGSVTYYWKGEPLSCSFDHDYDWSQLLYRYWPWGDKPNYNERQGDFIATLLRDIGYSIHMNYGSGYEGSGTAEENAAKALTTYFKYDKSVSYLCRDYCTTQYWEDMLRREIAAGRPVMYGGGSDVGAHEYTCDGYDAQGRFFFHMGSTGIDGYYATLSPDLQYTTSQTAVFRIMPRNDAAATGKATMLVGSNKDFIWKQGTSITSNVRFFTPVESFNAELAVAVENTATGDVSYCNQQSLTTSIENNNGTVVTDFSVSGTFPDGTYKVYPVYRDQAGGRWEKVLFGEYCQDYVTLTVSGGQQTFSNDNIRENIDEGKVKIGGIVYTLNDASGTAAVTYQNNSYNSYSGDVVIPATVSYGDRTYRVSAIDEKAFYDCDDLQSVVIGSNVESIGYGAFYSSKVSTVTFAEGSRLNTIATFAFYYSSITDIKLPEGVRTISNEAFNATDLKHVDIPSTVTYLGKNAFAYCSWIETFTNRCTTPLGSLTDDPFSGISEFWLGTMTLYVPKGCREAYAAHPVWSRFGKIVELDEEVTPPVDPDPETPVDPDPDDTRDKYFIQLQGTDLYFSTNLVDDHQYKTYSLSSTPEPFYIEQTDGGYTITSALNGKHVGFSTTTAGALSTWDFCDEASTWVIDNVEGEPTRILKKNYDVGFGADTAADGEGVYTDKKGPACTNCTWVITPAEEQETVYTFSPSTDATRYFSTDKFIENGRPTYCLSSTPEYFRVKKVEGGYTIQSAKTGQYAGISTDKHWDFADEPTVWNISAFTGTVTILRAAGETTKGFGWNDDGGTYTDKVGMQWTINAVPYSGDSAGLLVNMVRRAIASKCTKEDVEAVINNILLRKQ